MKQRKRGKKMITSYKIVIKCQNPKDEERYGRTLYINQYESANTIFKVLANSALENIIDPYVVEMYYPDNSNAPGSKCRI